MLRRLADRLGESFGILHRECAKIFKPDQQHVDAVPVSREHAAGIQQSLHQLVERREPDLERGLQLAAPKKQRRLKRLGGK